MAGLACLRRFETRLESPRHESADETPGLWRRPRLLRVVRGVETCGMAVSRAFQRCGRCWLWLEKKKEKKRKEEEEEESRDCLVKLEVEEGAAEGVPQQTAIQVWESVEGAKVEGATDQAQPQPPARKERSRRTTTEIRWRPAFILCLQVTDRQHGNRKVQRAHSLISGCRRPRHV